MPSIAIVSAQEQSRNASEALGQVRAPYGCSVMCRKREHMSEDLLYVSDDLPADHRAGFVAVVGKPNVGKSTLMNALLGQKVAIVSEKPQTTRHRILGILTRPDAQLVFMDTPGLHKPHNKLGEAMVETARRAIPDADLVCFLVDVSQSPNRADEIIAEMVSRSDAPRMLIMNKVDLLRPDQVELAAAPYRALGQFDAEALVSATAPSGLDVLLELMVELLPYGPRYYPEDQVTDQQERLIAAELIREQVLAKLREEVPHAVAVVVEQFKEREDGKVYIDANVFVEKDSQKGILIGRGGSMLKQIGQDARRQIEAMIDAPVYLELWVKVLKNWRKKEHLVRRLGYDVPKK